MKKLIIIFVMLFSITCFSQNKLSYSIELEPLIKEFVNEASSRDLILFDNIIENVDWIILTDNLPIDKLGALDRENRIIYIRNGMEIMSARITLYHELGHLLANDEHTCYACTDIMSENALDSYYFYDDKFYKIEMDKFFNYIKPFIK